MLCVLGGWLLLQRWLAQTLEHPQLDTHGLIQHSGSWDISVEYMLVLLISMPGAGELTARA